MKRSSIPRVWLDRAVNLALLWSGSLLTGSGLAMKYRVGYEAPRGARVWGMDGEDWGRLHWILSLVILALIACHLFRHWRWLWGVLTGRMSVLVAGIVLVCALLILAPLLGPGASREAETSAAVPTTAP